MNSLPCLPAAVALAAAAPVAGETPSISLLTLGFLVIVGMLAALLPPAIDWVRHHRRPAWTEAVARPLLAAALLWGGRHLEALLTDGSSDERDCAGFLVFAVAFVALLILVVRFGRFHVRSQMPYVRGLALTFSFVGLLVAAWWSLTRGAPEARLVQPLILPSPAEVLHAFAPLHLEQGLVRSAFSSWLRVTAGFALATIVAVPLGVFMGTFPPVAAFFRPLSLAGAYVPIVVFIPLSLTWFGTGEAQKIGFLFIGCFVALLPLVIKDIADVPREFLDVAVTKGATQWQLVRRVLFPVAQANIWDHLRGVYGVGWGWIIMAEVVVRPQYGLGGLIEVSERRSQTEAIYAVIIVIVLIALACDRLWRLGGELLFPYRAK